MTRIDESAAPRSMSSQISLVSEHLASEHQASFKASFIDTPTAELVTVQPVERECRFLPEAVTQRSWRAVDLHLTPERVSPLRVRTRGRAARNPPF